jgi:hypothetical protein
MNNNDTWTYEEYIEWDREYRDVEYLLEKYDTHKPNVTEYIIRKYFDE